MKRFRPAIPPARDVPQSAPSTGQPPVARCFRWDGTNLILCVKVHPRGGKFQLGKMVGGYLQVKVAAPPEDGKATDELLTALAKVFGVRPGAVELQQGAFSVRKVVRIECPRTLPPQISG